METRGDIGGPPQPVSMLFFEMINLELVWLGWLANELQCWEQTTALLLPQLLRLDPNSGFHACVQALWWKEPSPQIQEEDYFEMTLDCYTEIR